MFKICPKTHVSQDSFYLASTGQQEMAFMPLRYYHLKTQPMQHINHDVQVKRKHCLELLFTFGVIFLIIAGYNINPFHELGKD